MSEIVFILGAGASKRAGGPLMAEFLDVADELRESEDGKELKDDFDPVFDAIAYLQPVHSKAALDLYNIESVFAAFEMGKLLGKLPGKETRAETEQLLTHIKTLIVKTLERKILFPILKDNTLPNKPAFILPPKPYHSFAQLLNDLNDGGPGIGRRKRCTIITFNYDIALDYALHTQKHPADYCLSESEDPARTYLMKLHGSLNWARCSKPECRKIVPWHFPDYFSRNGVDPFYLQEHDSYPLPLGSRLPSSKLKCCGDDCEYVPVIVPPTWNKTEHHQGLSVVWTRAASELSDAENIFVCGYSLPESDLFFRYLFALGSVGRSLIKRFWVFDPDDTGGVRDRFLGLLGQAAKDRFRYEPMGFISAIKFIRKEFLKKNPDDSS